MGYDAAIHFDQEIQDHLVGSKRQHLRDLERGFGSVYLPFALERKYPNANQEWA